MSTGHLEGLIAAPFTPMKKDGSLNLSQIPLYYEMLRANGVKGAFICGSTGEGMSLTNEEKKQVAEAWAKATDGAEDFPIITLLGGTSLADCRDLAIHAQSVGLHAVAFTSPFYFKPQTVELLAQACKEVAASVPSMPFYYYHIPVLTGVGFAMYDLLQAIDDRIPNFAGIKYTHEDFMDFLSCMNFRSGRYDMLWGRDENMLPALSLGTKGAVGSTFNYAPSLYLDMIKAFKEGDLAKANSLQQQSIDMIRLLGKYGGIATGKAYMKLIGLDCGSFRLPVKNMRDSEFEQFKNDTDGIGFKQFCSRLTSGATIRDF